MKVIYLLLSLIILMIFGFLIKLIIANDKLQEWADVATILGGVVTAISLLWAAFTFYEGAKLQKELAAASIYQEHMKLSIDNPNLSNARLAPVRPTDTNSPEEKQRYEKYQWYVGHALYSFETILEVFPDDNEWKKTAGAFIRDHQAYIGSEGFPCDRYSSAIQNVIKEVLGKDCTRK